MKERTWSEVKESTNICLVKMNGKLSIFEDPVLTIFNNDLPSALKEIAVYTFVYGKGCFGTELLDIRNGLNQLQEKGFMEQTGATSLIDLVDKLNQTENEENEDLSVDTKDKK